MNGTRELERALAEFWTAVLDIDEVDETSHFLRSGGQSLAAIRLLAMIRGRFSISIEPAWFLSNPTFAALTARVKAEAATAAPSPPQQAQDSGCVPLSFGQERLWILDSLQPGNPAYHVPVILELEGPLRAGAFAAAFARILDRHQILRTVFVTSGDLPCQQPGGAAATHLRVIDLTSLNPAEAAAQADRWTMYETARPFDLTSGPLVRGALLRLGPQQHRVVLAAHHIVSDRWSMEVLIHEWAALYNTKPLPPLTFQYSDFAIAQRLRLTAESIKPQVTAAANRLRSVPVLELPRGRPETARPPRDLAEVEFSLPAEIRESLSQLAQNCGTTLFSPLLAAYVILLSRYSGQKDFAIGVPFANREGPEFESQVGFYVNTLVLRSRLAGLAERESVASLVKAIRDEWLGALEQSDLPLEKLVEALHPERAAGRNPLFQALMFWNTRPDKRADRKFPGLFHELRLSVRDHNPGSQVDLTLTLTLNDGDAIAGHLAYDSRRFERSTVERMAANLVEIARSFGSDGSIPLDEVPCPAAAEREWLARLSKSDTTAPVESTVSEEFERIARERPDTIAVVAGGLEITYGELHRRADAFGVRLLKAGVGQGSVVGLLLERSPLMLIALLGTLRIGAAYLPLSTDLPTARIRSMVADAGAAAVVVEPGGPVTGPLGTAQIVVIDTTASDHAEAIPVEYPIPCDLAYLIFTSGSTGSPKAVMVEHRQLTTFFAAMDRAVGPPGNAPWLAATSFGFDISILELLWTLSRGARVVLAEVEKPGPPRRTRTAEKVDLSLFFFGAGGDRPAPATYRMLLDAAQFADRSGFSAVWTPERHFHRFGGAYPNPSVTAAAIAAVTRRIAIRAGSVVLPLHDPLRVAEEWAVVDNISNGRVALSFASGWHSRDFVLAPSKWNRRKENLAGDIDVVRRLWRGEAIARTTPEGGAVDIRSLPRPVQPELPVWLTAAGSRETFRQAAEIGASVLTHLLGQSLDELSSKVEEYRAAWRARGRPGDGYVTLMLHTYVGLETKAARDLVREPLRQYLATALDLAGWLTGALDLPDRAEDSSALVERALDRFLEAGALIGDAHSCRETIERARCAGIDEIACLVDFGLADETVLQGLERLAQLHSRQHVRPARPPAEPLPVLLQRHQIANFQCTPSLAAALLDDPLAVTALGNLDRLIVGGEPLPSTLAARLARCTRTVYNAYGPTETTIWSTIHRVHRNEDGPFVPLGQPIAGTEVYVTDARLRLVPQGARGELLISGAGLSRGYAGRPDLTAERFVPNPFSTSPGERLYRTGDRVQRDAAGSLRFLGRTDDQVKLRGFRIEPGEIRAAINQHHRVRDSFVVLDDASGPRLVAWVVPVRNGHNGASSGHLTAPGLLAFLQERLPHYMVPAEVSFIDALPLNRNGKVDRGALRRPAEHSARIHVEPQGPTQLLLARVFREVLGVTQVGAHDNFFQLGGQSLLAMQAMFRIRRETGLTLPLQSLFEAQSVAELAQLIDTVRWIPARPMSESERRSRGFEEVRL